jgi:hypothetical protein
MRIQIMILIGFLLGACTPQPTQIPPSADETAIPSATAATGADQIQSAAIADLSQRLSLEPKLIHVKSMESQLWPDVSLGCPEPGSQYAQQTVPGYRLQLEANGINYIYHTDTKDKVIFCMEDDPPSFPVTPGEIDDGDPWMPVN